MAAAPRHEHLPPLLRGIGFGLVLLASVLAGTVEHRRAEVARAKYAQLHAQAAAVDVAAGSGAEAIARELRLLRLQLADDDLLDNVIGNRWFQVLGALGSALVAASFLLEAGIRWPRARGDAAGEDAATRRPRG